MNFRSKAVTRDKEGCSVVGAINQEAVIIINVYAPNIRTPKHIK